MVECGTDTAAKFCNRHRRPPPRVYRYDQIDRMLVAERVAEYRDQTARFLSGQLSEDEFKPLRLRNGLYVQRHAPMLRIAIPYGVLSAKQPGSRVRLS